MATAQEIGRIDKILGNAAAMDKTSLIMVNQSWDKRSKAVREDFGDQFHGAVLQRDGPEGVCWVGLLFFGKEDQVSIVNSIEVNRATELVKERRSCLVRFQKAR